MVKRFAFILLAALLASGLAREGRAELFAVSAATFGNTIYPLWYQDFSDPAASADANPDYGLGPTAGGLKLELCPNTMPAFCISAPPAGGLEVGAESFWWSAAATFPIPTGVALDRPGQALLDLALEGAFPTETPVAGQELSFGRIRIRVDVPVAGVYTITHPFGVRVENVTTPGGRAINFTEDIGIGAAGVFTGALSSNIGPFLVHEVPVFATLTDGLGNFFVGDLGATRVLGSPNGTNIFRVDGPPGSGLGGPGIDFIETDLFSVTGKVFTGDGNTSPVANADAAATLAGTPIVLNVLANDTFTDIPIHPGSLTINAPVVGGTAVKTIVDGRVRVTYTPAPGFTGDGGFSYTIQNMAGTADAGSTGTVTVIVEDLQVAKAEFRPKLLKWRITGTSSDVTANTIGIQSGPPTVNAALSGAANVPPRASPGGGSASVTVGDTSIAYTLSITGLLNITSTHLHLGAPGQNGPILFTLAGANVTSVPNGTLTAADLQVQAAQGINTFSDAVNAILSGQTYVEVHTAAFPDGELRGQLGPNRLVGSAAVQPDGSWTLEGKSDAFPDAARTISVRSSNGVQVIDVPLKVK